ncbi:hypothetical protein Tco_1273672 [Tanacetum coccineum]
MLSIGGRLMLIESVLARCLFFTVNVLKFLQRFLSLNSGISSEVNSSIGHESSGEKKKNRPSWVQWKKALAPKITVSRIRERRAGKLTQVERVSGRDLTVVLTQSPDSWSWSIEHFWWFLPCLASSRNIDSIRDYFRKILHFRRGIDIAVFILCGIVMSGLTNDHLVLRL